MQSIFGRFWPILGIGKKKIVKKSIIDLTNLNYYIWTSALKTSFWANLKKFDFLAISWFSRYLGEAALNLSLLSIIIMYDCKDRMVTSGAQPAFCIKGFLVYMAYPINNSLLRRHS